MHEANFDTAMSFRDLYQVQKTGVNVFTEISKSINRIKTKKMLIEENDIEYETDQNGDSVDELLIFTENGTEKRYKIPCYQWIKRISVIPLNKKGKPLHEKTIDTYWLMEQEGPGIARYVAQLTDFLDIYVN